MHGVIYSEKGKSSLWGIKVLLCEDCGHPISTLSIESTLDENKELVVLSVCQFKFRNFYKNMQNSYRLT